MTKLFKIISITFLSIIIISILTTFLIFLTPPSVKFDDKLLKKEQNSIIIYDKYKNEISVSSSNLLNATDVQIPEITKKAFIAIEDKNFYKHRGIDIKRILGATLENLKSKSYKQGASTISQQLIKNTHLTSEKTLTRKIDEIKLAKKLEKKYTKDEILNMYLNTIYFGENAYGIEQASNLYFSKSSQELNVNESATLAGLIVAPSKLNPIVNISECKRRRNLVLTKMREQNFIDDKIEKTVKNEDIPLNYNSNYVKEKSFISACINELKSLQEHNPYKFKSCKIYTQFNLKMQETITNSKPNIDTDFQAMILDNKLSLVNAYYSTCGEIARCPASTAKTYIAYAPAIEEGLINEYTQIIDEKTDFNGYSPKNYKDKYYNSVSAKKALSLSLNVASVKVLNTVGIDKAKQYAKDLEIDITANNLGIALGAFENNIKLIKSVGAYSTFANLGEYKTPQFIDYIEDFNGKTIYKRNNNAKRVFSEGTSSIICDMLKETVNSGTSKGLRNLNFTVYSKTGTNGNSEGNLDAYNLSFTKKHTFAVWLGNSDNSLMDNSITGSSYPTSAMREILCDTYENESLNDIEYKGIKTYTLDKMSYDNKGEILLASKNTPKKYTFTGIFNDKNYPKNESTIFENPKIFDYSLNFSNNKVEINYNCEEFVKVEIYKVLNDKDSLIFDGNTPYSEVLNGNIQSEYYIIPYIEGVNGKVYGDKIYLGKINTKSKKSETPTIPKDWWRN